ncbi:MAG: ATP-binding cassette domain-containing protein [Actinobacteria bacterium]|nr:ATP-binding cassette domain-containing protein [Actinomycetota bacterium]
MIKKVYREGGAYSSDMVIDEVSVSVKRLTKNYGKITAVNDISFDVLRGEIFGFLGPNGAGKTTTIRIITTATKADSGEVYLNSFDILKNPLEAKNSMGVVSQYINLDMELTCKENLIVHGMLHNMKKRKILERIDYLLDYIEIKDKENVQVEKISGGMQRKLMIARALMHEPEILFLDEPTVGLDAHSKRKIWDLMVKINSENKTIFLTTHYIEEAQQLCNRVAIINSGNLIEVDTPENMIDKIGIIALDVFNHDDCTTYFFDSREKALESASKMDGKIIIREANLEDVFLDKTGRRVKK